MDKGIEEENIRFSVLVNFPPGFKIGKYYKIVVLKWQRLPFRSPFEDVSAYDLRSLEEQKRMEKRAVATIHELLSLTVERIAHFRMAMDLPKKLKVFLLQHQGMFYLSTRGNHGKLHTVFLRDAYKRGELIEPNDLYLGRGKSGELVLLSPRKAKVDMDLDNLRDNQNEEEHCNFDTDADVDFEITDVDIDCVEITDSRDTTVHTEQRKEETVPWRQSSNRSLLEFGEDDKRQNYGEGSSGNRRKQSRSWVDVMRGGLTGKTKLYGDAISSKESPVFAWFRRSESWCETGKPLGKMRNNGGIIKGGHGLKVGMMVLELSDGWPFFNKFLNSEDCF
ncbi:Plant organelle RNA recognition domain [Dillenia turbinata]|uniref:Plant organelle RNA recognition domain n=1 Tax=Dillenia turbinata TaxID=194707 RepID=A0AAN8ZAD0_9MAGN